MYTHPTTRNPQPGFTEASLSCTLHGVQIVGGSRQTLIQDLHEDPKPSTLNP